MKKLTLIFAFLAFLGQSAFAQNLPGTWQGTIKTPNRDLRIVFKVTTTDADALKAVMYSIDQSPLPLAAGAVTLQNLAVKIPIPGAGGAFFEGRMNADGNSITGTWNQGPTPLPLVLTRANPQTAWALGEAPPMPKAMAADADPAFEVATIKPSKPDTRGPGIGLNGQQFTTIGTSLSFLMTFAYGIHARQIVGAPGWVESDKWDWAGKPEGGGMPNTTQLKTMIQKLLVERYGLKFHKEKRELSVFVLLPGKTGPKMTPSAADTNGVPTLGFRRLGDFFARNASMSDVAQTLQATVMDRPVVDQTGLAGRFDFTLTWTPDESQFTAIAAKPPAPAADKDAPPDLFTAIQQQIGLRLESTKASVEVYVIDHVEKPSEN
jgi:uncharacterized protein (TIGR03435 family)